MGCLSSKEANETNANPSVRVTSSTNNPPQEQQRDGKKNKNKNAA